MDESLLVSSSNFSPGEVGNVEKFRGFTRKKLSDITNLHDRLKPTNVDPKNRSTVSITAKEFIEKLQMEIAKLMKLLADRDKLMELSAVELRKLRANVQNLQLQNLKLAQTNSQMMAELNSGKDRLKVLQHDLACQHGLLKATKFEAKERRKRTAACQKDNNHEVASSRNDDLDQPSHEDKENESSVTFGTSMIMKQLKKQSLGCPLVKSVNDNEVPNIKRHCTRRQSARLKSKEAESIEDSFEVDDSEFPVSSLHDDPVGMSSQTLTESSVEKDNERNVVSENVNPPIVSEVPSRNELDKKRRSRRQSSRFIKYEATENLFETEGSNLDASSLRDDNKESAKTVPGSSFNEEEGNSSTGIKSQETRPSFVGRPTRRAAVQVQSYKETPINVKMRRPS